MQARLAENWKVTYEMALEVAAHEALIRQTYRDSVGVETWCVGMTSATGHDVRRYINKPASLNHCMKLYAWALENYAEGVRLAFKGIRLTEAQFAAALSFHWNTGAIKRAKWVQHWRSGRKSEARKAFMRYRRPPEIIGRRRKEQKLFFDGVWSNNGTMVEYTRLTKRRTPVWSSAKTINVKRALKAAFETQEAIRMDIPAKPDSAPEAKTLTRPEMDTHGFEPIKDHTASGGAAAGAGTIGSVVLEQADQVSVVAEFSPILKWVFVGLILLGVTLLVWPKFKSLLKPSGAAA